jgi:hypothetical protein
MGVAILIVSIKERTHRQDAEDAEKRIFDQKMLRTPRTLRLCGKIFLLFATFAFFVDKSLSHPLLFFRIDKPPGSMKHCPRKRNKY